MHLRKMNETLRLAPKKTEKRDPKKGRCYRERIQNWGRLEKVKGIVPCRVKDIPGKPD